MLRALVLNIWLGKDATEACALAGGSIKTMCYSGIHKYVRQLGHGSMPVRRVYLKSML